MTEVNFTYQNSGGTWEIPQDPNCSARTADPCPHYINQIDISRSIVANQYVQQFGVRLDFFETESGYDFLSYGQRGSALTSISGTQIGGTWRDFGVSGSLQSTPGMIHFHADEIVSDEGFSIGRARVCCQSTPQTTPAYLRHNERHSGVLLGTNDVVYLQAPVSCGQENSIAMWGDPASGNDFDVYARCNALPTPTTYDHATLEAGSQEFRPMPSSGCTCPGTWYFAVHSWSGSGWFHVVYSSRYNSQSRTITAGTNFVASTAQMNTFEDTLTQAARQFWGSTDGSQRIAAVHLYNSNSCTNCGGATCDLCFRNEPGTGYCCDNTLNSQLVI